MSREEVTQLPEGASPFGTGPVFVVRLHEDATSCHGNVIARAGLYEAQQASGSPEGHISVWSPDHYAGAMWVGLPIYGWSFADEAQRPLPEHDCDNPDNWKSGVAGGIFCAICMVEVAA